MYAPHETNPPNRETQPARRLREGSGKVAGVSKVALARRQQRREEVGRRVAAARDAKDWSQETFGKQLGKALRGKEYTPRTVARIEAGEVAMYFELADVIGALLEIDPRSLMPDERLEVPKPRTAAPTRKKQPSPPPGAHQAIRRAAQS
jgi:transcriptional regulator with XRE-family HTH domain